tara:strand:- start:2721 stop:2984 length:264 start_codon:yes stop_codon:yes gene_type:complete
MVRISEEQLDVIAQALLESQAVFDADGGPTLVSLDRAINVTATLLYQMRQESKERRMDVQASLHEFKAALDNLDQKAVDDFLEEEGR